MALIKCRECGAQVSTKAKTCPSCGGQPKKPMSMLRFIGYLVAGFVVLFGIRACHDAQQAKLTPAELAAREQARATRQAEEAKKAAEKKARDDEKACSNDVSAFVMSQSFVKQRLKAPASADFPNISSEGVKTSYMGDCTHQVLAYVDSQNSFGAKIRTKYYVKLKNQKGTDDWQLLDIKIFE